MADSCENTNELLANSADSKNKDTKNAVDGQCSKSEAPLPPLSAADFRVFNNMAERMNMFHEHFRSMWNTLWNACTANRRPQGMSIRQFITVGLRFTGSLTMHHDIEEAHVFPLLARKMPDFDRHTGPMVLQHREIHAGLDLMQDYLERCHSGEADLELAVLRAKMETWGEVLWAHLDAEVKTLGAENMRRFWSKQEMMQMPM